MEHPAVVVDLYYLMVEVHHLMSKLMVIKQMDVHLQDYETL
jgi:hypothetical protein